MKYSISLAVMMMCIHMLIGVVVSTKLEGSARGLNSRIIGGTRVNATRYPYFTYLRVFLQSGNIWTCGGSLVHSDVVLTSASCITYTIDPIVSIKAYVNYTESIVYTWKLSEYVYKRVAKAWIPHEKYNESTLEDNIGLVILNKPVIQVSPVKLNDDVNLPPDGTPVTAIGHGVVSEGATPGIADYLNEVEISIVSFEDCNDLNSWRGFVKESQICAGASAGGRGTCIGDFGGPLLMVGGTASDDLQVGLSSFVSSYDCVYFDLPNVFTRLSNYTEWIRDNICQHSNVRPNSCINSKPTQKPIKKPTKKPVKKPTKKPVKKPTKSPT